MSRSLFIIVSDSPEEIRTARNYAQSQGLAIQCFSTYEWESRQKSYSHSPLASGSQPVNNNGNVLPFPGQGETSSSFPQKKVATINELESQAIEKAIYEFNGNLTEAAKALGIGRATLYRKVKQYNIDTSLARRQRRAA